MSPNDFARILAADLGLRSEAFAREVARSIEEQLQSFHTIGPIPGTMDQRLLIRVRRRAAQVLASGRHRALTAVGGADAVDAWGAVRAGALDALGDT